MVIGTMGNPEDINMAGAGVGVEVKIGVGVSCGVGVSAGVVVSIATPTGGARGVNEIIWRHALELAEYV